MNQSSGSNEERLLHSLAGLLRASQILDQECTVFVEGTDIDPFYYGAVLEAVSRTHNATLNIVSSREINAPGRGKGRCITYFNYLLESSNLVSKLADKTTTNFFILDKDIDDILGCMLPSRHICYTKQHSVENHLFAEADVRTAIAAVTSAPPHKLTVCLPDPKGWMNKCALVWREWTILCIASLLLGGKFAGYSQPSPLNVPPDAPTDLAALQEITTSLASRSECTKDFFDAAMRRATEIFDEAELGNRLDTLFKGKWYAGFASRLSRTELGIETFNEKALWATLLARLDETHEGSEHFRSSLSYLLSSLN